jgi:hypothetical protein
MGRPKLKDSKKRVHVNISVRKDVAELAKNADNASRVYESAVDICQSISSLMRNLESDKTDVNDVLEDIHDLMSIWNSRFEEKVEFSKLQIDDKAV